MKQVCDMCGESGPSVRVLSHSAVGPDAAGSDEPWRVARACGSCLEGKVMPTLRWLFGGSPWMSGSGPGRYAVDPPMGSLFRSFETGAGTTHVAAEVLTGPALGFRTLCVAECGIEAVAVPNAKSALLESRGEGVCSRCEASRPEVFG